MHLNHVCEQRGVVQMVGCIPKLCCPWVSADNVYFDSKFQISAKKNHEFYIQHRQGKVVLAQQVDPCCTCVLQLWQCLLVRWSRERFIFTSSLGNDAGAVRFRDALLVRQSVVRIIGQKLRKSTVKSRV